MYTRIRNTDTVLQILLSIRARLLCALVQVAFNHHAHDGLLAARDLLGKRMCDLGLVLVVLERVAVGAVDHERGPQIRFRELLFGFGYALGVL